MSIHAAAALAESHDLAGQYKGEMLRSALHFPRKSLIFGSINAVDLHRKSLIYNDTRNPTRFTMTLMKPQKTAIF